MKEIKFRYRIISADGVIKYYYFTLKQIENYIGLREDALKRAGMKILSRDLYSRSKDKNGKEIYERDIIKYKSFVGVIVFQDGLFLAIFKNKNPWDVLANIDLRREIIGNMDENPELLVE